MIERIFLDLDGVLADWTTAAILACGRDPKQVYGDWPSGTYDLAEALGVSTNVMWRAVHAGGFEFWRDLAIYPWAPDLYETCRSFASTTILTSPSREPASLAGKLAWLQRVFGRTFADYLIGPNKTPCARPGAVLIDDREHGCLEFERAGGRAIVFPQIWNPLGRCDDPVAHVRGSLERIHQR